MTNATDLAIVEGGGQLATTSAANFLPIMQVQDAVNRRAAVLSIAKEAMTEGVHYGPIPGTETKKPDGTLIPGKNTLLKPGAEMLTNFFGLTPTFDIIEAEKDWLGETHGGESFLSYTIRCNLRRGEWLIASAEASINSWEKKFRWRNGERACPECGAPQIRKSKNKPEWYCWQKMGGCGATFGPDDPRIIGQEVGRVPNPDIADTENTLLKVCEKRAFVAATLLATSASELFTQDQEDVASSPQAHRDHAPTFDVEPEASRHDVKQEAQPEPQRSLADLNDEFKVKAIEYGFVASDTVKYRDLKVILSSMPPDHEPARDIYTRSLAATPSEWESAVKSLMAPRATETGDKPARVEMSDLAKSNAETSRQVQAELTAEQKLARESIEAAKAQDEAAAEQYDPFENE